MTSPSEPARRARPRPRPASSSSSALAQAIEPCTHGLSPRAYCPTPARVPGTASCKCEPQAARASVHKRLREAPRPLWPGVRPPFPTGADFSEVNKNPRTPRSGRPYHHGGKTRPQHPRTLGPPVRQPGQGIQPGHACAATGRTRQWARVLPRGRSEGDAGNDGGRRRACRALVHARGGGRGGGMQTEGPQRRLSLVVRKRRRSLASRGRQGSHRRSSSAGHARHRRSGTTGRADGASPRRSRTGAVRAHQVHMPVAGLLARQPTNRGRPEVRVGEGGGRVHARRRPFIFSFQRRHRTRAYALGHYLRR